ncbi:hypothetical protein D8674_041480 [Pyrus ussuriensis x Pyrus communis]|uniref:LisH domain-containing protein n=1 Tax=Pyrus ussuriensis x Pyrus communis TaxID=2448454 RepID=A0A5N5HKL9_9ROSA|nr:hypothetical protein D8674_041480 [Pyrus ussuriensis x Pyrus communis]
MGKPSKGKKSEKLGKGKVTPVQIAFIVDQYLCDNNYLVTHSLFRTEALSFIAKLPIREASKSLLSMMNTYNAGGSPVSVPSVVALKPMLMATPSHPPDGSAAGIILSLPLCLFALCLKNCLNELRNLVKVACLVRLHDLNS